MSKIEELIDSIEIVRGNLSHIEQTGKINGTLRSEIRRVIEEYRIEDYKEPEIKIKFPIKELNSSKNYPLMILDNDGYTHYFDFNGNYDGWSHDVLGNKEKYISKTLEKRKESNEPIEELLYRVQPTLNKLENAIKNTKNKS